VSGKRSNYLDAGSPTSCFLPSCKQAFVDKCIRGSDGHFYCSQKCADKVRTQEVTDVNPSEDVGLSKKGAQIATVSECINHCFAFDMWCYDFARPLDPEDTVMGLQVAVDLLSDATRLHSFVALRKLDEFFRTQKSQCDDLIASDLGIDRDAVLGGAGKTFLTPTERVGINKGAAHLTEKLTLDPDTEVDLQAIVARSRPVFERLSATLRKADAKGEVKHWLDKTDALLKYAREEAERVKQEMAARRFVQARSE
jgi:hypothetical protein